MKFINRLGLSAFLIGAGATLGYRFGFFPYNLAFLAFIVAMLVCALVVFVGIFFLAVSIYKKKRFQSELVPLLIGCAIFPILAFSGVGADIFKAPMIHDITTDTDNPPVFIFIQPDDGYRVNSLVYPGAEVSVQQKLAYPDIQTFITSLPPRQVYQKAIFVASLLGWEIIAKDLPSFRFEAVTRTPLFGFVDDIAVRITPIGAEGSAVDVRSMSRVGISDLGTNAKRIRRFLGELEQELINLQ
ncbi:MAG: DUF1499 domain-containing protein [Sinobacterium sp.]|jgi:uncharacterized protein (DUF1499 family)|tara:strand:+ start:3434 stop:4162 length:729 start_codon:yes stop_codon:yes gene_type:complete